MPAHRQKSFFPLPEAPRMPRRRPHVLARVISTLAIIGVLLVAAIGIAAWRFDPNAYKPRIEAAITAATGRAFTIDGRVSIVSWLTPTIAITRARLANAAGAPQPAMLTIPRLVADLGVRALLAGRIDVKRLVLLAPDLQLERTGAGAPNWHFAPKPGAPPAEVSVRTLHVRDGRVVWRDAASGKTTTFSIARLSATSYNQGSSTRWSADLRTPAGIATLDGQTGALVRLLRPGATTPWSVYLRAILPDARFTLSGAMRQPWRPAGYQLKLTGGFDDSAALRRIAALFGHHLPTLPALQQIDLSATLADPGGHGRLQAASLSVGPGDLGGIVAGLHLEAARIAASKPGQPAAFTLSGTLHGRTISLAGTLGTLADLTARKPLPVTATLHLGGSRITARGTLGSRGSGADADLLLSGHMRDLSTLSALASWPLPPLQDVRATAHLITGPGGWRAGVRLPEFTLLLPQGDIAGSLAIDLTGARPKLAVRLRGSRLDLDRVAAQLGDYRFLPLPPGPPTAALPIPRTIRPLIPDDAFDLRWLRLADLRLALDFGELDIAGLPLKDVRATATITDGALAAEPVTAQLAGGPLALRLRYDTRQNPARLRLGLDAPALSVQALLQALGSTQDVTGTLALHAHIAGHGQSLHALAASATGRLDASIADGTIANAVLAPAFVGVLRVAHLPPSLLFAPGQTRLNCFALGLDSKDGAARLAPFLLDSGRALVQAGGTVAFGPETLALHLRPVLRVGPGLEVPVLLAGSFRAPVLTLDKAALTGRVAARLAAAVAGRPLPGGRLAPSDAECKLALSLVNADTGGAAAAAPHR